jgi:hypothetical protein
VPHLAAGRGGGLGRTHRPDPSGDVRRHRWATAPATRTTRKACEPSSDTRPPGPLIDCRPRSCFRGVARFPHMGSGRTACELTPTISTPDPARPRQVVARRGRQERFPRRLEPVVKRGFILTGHTGPGPTATIVGMSGRRHEAPPPGPWLVTSIPVPMRIICVRSEVAGCGHEAGLGTCRGFANGPPRPAGRRPLAAPTTSPGNRASPML